MKFHNGLVASASYHYYGCAARLWAWFLSPLLASRVVGTNRLLENVWCSWLFCQCLQVLQPPVLFCGKRSSSCFGPRKWKWSAHSSDGTVKCATFALTLVILFPAPRCESRNGLASVWFTKTPSVRPLPVSIVFDSVEMTVVQLLHSFLPGWAKPITWGDPIAELWRLGKKNKTT